MNLVQILLPLYDNAGKTLPHTLFTAVRDELTEHFGGLTVYTRAPAEGLWKSDEDEKKRDDIVIYEVMAKRLSKSWWRKYRSALEDRFKQQEIIIRGQRIQIL